MKVADPFPDSLGNSVLVTGGQSLVRNSLLNSDLRSSDEYVMIVLTLREYTFPYQTPSHTPDTMLVRVYQMRGRCVADCANLRMRGHALHGPGGVALCADGSASGGANRSSE